MTLSNVNIMPTKTTLLQAMMTSQIDLWPHRSIIWVFPVVMSQISKSLTSNKSMISLCLLVWSASVLLVISKLYLSIRFGVVNLQKCHLQSHLRNNSYPKDSSWPFLTLWPKNKNYSLNKKLRIFVNSSFLRVRIFLCKSEKTLGNKE